MSKETYSVYDSAHFLETEEDIQFYLRAAAKDADTNPKHITRAMGVAVRARLFTALAEQAGVSRDTMIKVLTGEGAPSLTAINKVAKGLGVKMVAPAKPARPAARAVKAA